MSYDPRSNLVCLALQLACEPGVPPTDSEWASRAMLDEDGTCHLVPLLPRDVPAWVESIWWSELPTPYVWSFEP